MSKRVRALEVSSPAVDRTPSKEEIARRAYALYEERGRIDGADLDDWLQAEQELSRPETD
jgi:hypothetical protein